MMRDRVQGKLIFVTAAGGVRYLRIRLACTLTGVRQIAMLGHELRHAVEVANAPWVLDESSLADEYRRIGFPSRDGSNATAFESAPPVVCHMNKLWRVSVTMIDNRPIYNLQSQIR